MKDEELVALFWQRSELAVEETLKKYGAYCTYIAKNILGSELDAEECANEVLQAAWSSIPPQKPGNLKTYLGKLCRNIAISRWRQDHAAKRFTGEFSASLDELEEVASDENLAADVEQRQLSQAISAFLRTLPSLERNVLIRRFWYSDSVHSICQRFGLTEGKAKALLKKSREKLADYLKKEGYIS